MIKINVCNSKRDVIGNAAPSTRSLRDGGGFKLHNKNASEKRKRLFFISLQSIFSCSRRKQFSSPKANLAVPKGNNLAAAKRQFNSRVSANYSYSQTLAQESRSSLSSGLPFTDCEAATIGIQRSTYWRAVSVFSQKSLRYFSPSSFLSLRTKVR